MPEEVAVVLVVAIIAGSVSSVIKAAIKARQGRRTAGSESSGVTTSELRGMMREAVEEATLPLRAEIEELRDELRARRGLPPAEEKLLDPFVDSAEHEEPVTARRRTR